MRGPPLHTTHNHDRHAPCTPPRKGGRVQGTLCSAIRDYARFSPHLRAYEFLHPRQPGHECKQCRNPTRNYERGDAPNCGRMHAESPYRPQLVNRMRGTGDWRTSEDHNPPRKMQAICVTRAHFIPRSASHHCSHGERRPIVPLPRWRCPSGSTCEWKNVISNACQHPAPSGERRERETYVSSDPRKLTLAPAHHTRGNGDIITSYLASPRPARPLSPPSPRPSPPMSCLECAPPRMRSVRPRNASDALRRRARLHEIPASAAGPRQNSSTTTCTKRFQEAPPLPPRACPPTNPSHQTPSPAPPPGAETSRSPPPNHSHAPYTRTPPLATSTPRRDHPPPHTKLNPPPCRQPLKPTPRPRPHREPDADPRARARHDPRLGPQSAATQERRGRGRGLLYDDDESMAMEDRHSHRVPECNSPQARRLPCSCDVGVVAAPLLRPSPAPLTAPPSPWFGSVTLTVVKTSHPLSGSPAASVHYGSPTTGS
jgi:hypothetical protein